MNGTRAGAIGVVVLVAAVGCGRAAPGKAQPVARQAPAVARSVSGLDTFHRDDLKFFTAFTYPESAESEVYGSLDDALGSATAVVLAQVTGVRVTRIVGESPEDALPYMGVLLRPVEVLRGSLPPAHRETLTVEFVAPGGTANELRAMLPDGYAVWVLRNKAERPARSGGKPVPSTERDFYRLVSSQGLFVQGEKHVVNPLMPPEAPEMSLSGSGDHAAEIRDPVAVGAEQFPSLSSFAGHVRLL